MIHVFIYNYIMYIHINSCSSAKLCKANYWIQIIMYLILIQLFYTAKKNTVNSFKQVSTQQLCLYKLNTCFICVVFYYN